MAIVVGTANNHKLTGKDDYPNSLEWVAVLAVEKSRSLIAPKFVVKYELS